MAFDTKIRPYVVVAFTWTTPPTNEPIGLEAYGLGNTFTIMEGPDDVAVRLNDKSEHLLEWIEGIDGIPISEIFVTSAEATGTVKFYVAWEAQWE